MDFGESCEDGGNMNGDGCSSTCQNEVFSDPADPESPVVPEEPEDPFISINDCEDVVEFFSKLFNFKPRSLIFNLNPPISDDIINRLA